MATETMLPELSDAAAVEAFARAAADEVHDPCSMAIGIDVGLAEMGLIRHVSVAPGPEGWEVEVTLRLTSPGCQYFFYFQESLEERLSRHPGVARATVGYDQVFDWTPDDYAPSARAKVEARRIWLRTGC